MWISEKIKIKVKIKINILVLIILFGLLAPTMKLSAFHENAFLFFQVDKESFLDPDFLFLDVKINSKNNNYNVANIDISYDTNKLILQETKKEQSYCSFFVGEIVDNENGNYQLACGSIVNPNDQEQIIRLKFKKISEGFTNITFNDYSSLYLNNGHGTSMTIDKEVHNLYIIK